MKKKSKSALAALLPKGSTKRAIKPTQLAFLVIGPPKWGKTEFFMSNEDAVLLATEEGHKFQTGHKMIIDRWDASKADGYKNWTDDEGCPHMTFMQAVDVLETFKKFNMVIIDTAEMACNMCVDYHVEAANAEHIEDLGQYGKGWDLGLNVPFRKAIMRILKTGRGVVFICHSKLEIAKFTSGEKARKEARLPKTVKALLEAQADVIVHCELGKKRKGNRLRDRILVCEGDSDTSAGNRTGAMLPERYIVKRPGQWEQFAKFFSDPDYADKIERIYKKIYKKSNADD